MRTRSKRARNVKMKVIVVFLLVAAALLLAEGKDQELRIGVKKRPETCDMRSKNGDRLSMHYTVGQALFPLLTPRVTWPPGDTGRRDRVRQQHTSQPAVRVHPGLWPGHQRCNINIFF